MLPLHHTRISVAASRGARIRTGDLTDPNRARYRAAPRPEDCHILQRRLAKVKPQFDSQARIRRNHARSALAPWAGMGLAAAEEIQPFLHLLVRDLYINFLARGAFRRAVPRNPVNKFG